MYPTLEALFFGGSKALKLFLRILKNTRTFRKYYLLSYAVDQILNGLRFENFFYKIKIYLIFKKPP